MLRSLEGMTPPYTCTERVRREGAVAAPVRGSVVLASFKTVLGGGLLTLHDGGALWRHTAQRGGKAHLCCHSERPPSLEDTGVTPWRALADNWAPSIGDFLDKLLGVSAGAEAEKRDFTVNFLIHIGSFTSPRELDVSDGGQEQRTFPGSTARISSRPWQVRERAEA